ncbi:MAG: glycine betaine/L-proline ABC transporter ATP-binding protein [Oceanospirillaceae bacterium]|nr:glycine betaine/L-proline ABC transporter ATP-binding protein [Oceanospirillaceae bacterium]MBT6078571.1 glycine betaine/L-proline ABC transporter ATP-binding protein [Oceanospirillaceae bacterium]
MPDIKVSIKNLYKIFGPKGEDMVQKVEDGATKASLQADHKHVLGLNNVNIDIPARRIQVIMGLSGSGKSTLIRHLNRLIEPTAGQVLVDGEDVLAMSDQELREFRRNKMSMVFQKFALLPHRTVIDNVSYGLMIKGTDKVEMRERSQKWIDRVGLSGFEDNYPAQLSGGMQQRVGLARALATDAEILLMDEAFSALDPLIRKDMQEILLDLQEELHKTIIFITHDLDEALNIGDNIVILRDGAVIQQGSPQEIVLDPADDYVRDFIKDINRARVLDVSSVMESGSSDSGLSFAADTILESAMPAMSKADVTSANVTRDGEVIGMVTLADMIGGIARPESHEGDQVTYR